MAYEHILWDGTVCKFPCETVSGIVLIINNDNTVTTFILMSYPFPTIIRLLYLVPKTLFRDIVWNNVRTARTYNLHTSGYISR